MEDNRKLEDFTEEEINELEAEEAKGNKFLDVDAIVKLTNFTAEELADIEEDADAAYAEIEAEFDRQNGNK